MEMVIELDNSETRELLSQVCGQYGVDPLGTPGTEEFFALMLPQYTGKTDRQSVADWLNEQVPQWFSAVNERPRWRTKPEWPVIDADPGIFIGQIDVSVGREAFITWMYHQDVSFYLFVVPPGMPITIVQPR